MSDTFIHLEPRPVSAGPTANAAIKVLPQAEAKALFMPLPEVAKLQPAP